MTRLRSTIARWHEAWLPPGKFAVNTVARAPSVASRLDRLPITVQVSRQNGSYGGSVEITQRDFGIEPINIVGGGVKVKAS
jgi:hypothetical protein